MLLFCSSITFPYLSLKPFSISPLASANFKVGSGFSISIVYKSINAEPIFLSDELNPCFACSAVYFIVSISRFIFCSGVRVSKKSVNLTGSLPPSSFTPLFTMLFLIAGEELNRFILFAAPNTLLPKFSTNFAVSEEFARLTTDVLPSVFPYFSQRSLLSLLLSRRLGDLTVDVCVCTWEVFFFFAAIP